MTGLFYSNLIPAMTAKDQNQLFENVVKIILINLLTMNNNYHTIIIKPSYPDPYYPHYPVHPPLMPYPPQLPYPSYPHYPQYPQYPQYSHHPPQYPQYPQYPQHPPYKPTDKPYRPKPTKRPTKRPRPPHYHQPMYPPYYPQSPPVVVVVPPIGSKPDDGINLPGIGGGINPTKPTVPSVSVPSVSVPSVTIPTKVPPIINPTESPLPENTTTEKPKPSIGSIIRRIRVRTGGHKSNNSNKESDYRYDDNEYGEDEIDSQSETETDPEPTQYDYDYDEERSIRLPSYDDNSSDNSQEIGNSIAVNGNNIKLPFGIAFTSGERSTKSGRNQQTIIYLRNYKKGKMLNTEEDV